MKILIIENEVYLAQSIATKLSEIGHICELCTSTKDALKNNSYDVVLLSTNINGQDFIPVVEMFKRSIVILMVSYISNDTVSKPLSVGAKDYILKPFMIEELIRKINHYQDYERLKRRNETYEKYLNYAFNSLNEVHNFDGVEFPFFISCSFQKHTDSFAFEYARRKNMPICFISLGEANALSEIENSVASTLLYITDYQLLKKTEKKQLLDIISNKKAIISSTEKIEDVDFKIMEIKNDTNIFNQGEILLIEDYVKFVVMNYQHKLPDTELAKKLGISRKSLWEKRKKYDILKKK